eukprot:TRINITY_DN34140_c0_g1_i1.p1 TRINITY_DN34140_c0_g1~~TRINITY_DN34140_c0_g1_i1.p1  ORF type:complete len:194 (+),score=50.94 TRINITY_DN34140_c0_g1_i1:57-584(+)
MPRSSHNLATRKVRGKAVDATPPSSGESQITKKSAPSKGKLGRPVKKAAEGKKSPKLVSSQESTKRRKKNGQAALLEIKRLQKTQNNLISKAGFKQIVLEAWKKAASDGYRFKPVVFTMLQEASEAFMISYFQNAIRASIHAGRVTVTAKDLHFVALLRQSITGMIEGRAETREK